MRALIIVIDGFGIGALPDADQYGDIGANTAANLCKKLSQPKWPVLKRLGLGNCSTILNQDLPGCEAVPSPQASYGAMSEKSPGKDTTTGHWEIAGIQLDKPFHTFPPDFPSFPKELVDAFEQKINKKILGNKAASGTAIIEELGRQHLDTQYPICYTSADSVFQIAAHENVIPIDTLYEYCQIARELCDPYRVARIIARPFIGEPGSFSRTKRRKDFSIDINQDTLLDFLLQNKINTVGVGKIGNIFNEQGVAETFPDKGNPACVDRIIQLLKRNSGKDELIFVNLIDTDMLYGHRRDQQGYLDAVSQLDQRLPDIMTSMNPDDVMIITSDHGCDPTFKGTDHTREYVPLLWYQKDRPAENLGIRSSFADIAQSLVSYFKLSGFKNGVSFI